MALTRSKMLAGSGYTADIKNGKKNRWGDILVEGSKIRADRVSVRAFQVCSLNEDTRFTIPTGPIPNPRHQSCEFPPSATTALEFRPNFECASGGT